MSPPNNQYHYQVLPEKLDSLLLQLNSLGWYQKPGEKVVALVCTRDGRSNNVKIRIETTPIKEKEKSE